MRHAAAVAIAAFVLGACGAAEWSLDAVDASDGDAHAEASIGARTTPTASSRLCTASTSGQCVACVSDPQCTQLGLSRCDSVLERCVQ